MASNSDLIVTASVFAAGAAVGAGLVWATLRKPSRRRICFMFKGTADPILQAGYKAAHANVWPEMQAALQRQGWHNYSLFMRSDGTLVGVFESDRTLEACLDGMNKEAVNARWQESMGKYFPDAAGQRPDEVMTELESVMYLNI